MKFLLLVLSAVRCPPFRPTKKNSPDFAPPSDLRRPTWGQSYTVGSILYSGANPIQCKDKFFMVGLSVGGELDSRGHCRMADGGQTEVLTSLLNCPENSALGIRLSDPNCFLVYD